MKQLIPCVISRIGASDVIIKYIDKTRLNMELLGPILLDEFRSIRSRVSNMIDMAVVINQGQYLKEFLSFTANQIPSDAESMKRHYIKHLNLDTSRYGKKVHEIRGKQLESTIKRKRKSNG